MKYNLLIVILLCFSKTLIAQDALRVSTVIDSTFKTPQYEAVFDDVFLSHQETKQLFKWDPAAWFFSSDGGVNEQRFEYERKLSAAFSINTALFFHTSFASSRYAQSRNLMQSFGFSTSIEPRWYYQMAQKIATQQSANNLSGNYLGLKLGVEIIPPNWGSTLLGYENRMIDTFKFLRERIANNESHALKSYRLEASYGIQRRLFKRGYINFAFGLGIAKEEAVRIEDNANAVVSYRSFWRPYVNNRVSFGLVFGDGRRRGKTNIVSCDLFRCFEEENKLLKINLLGLLQTLDTRNISAKAGLSYEFWLLSHKNISLNSSVDLRGQYASQAREELMAIGKINYRTVKFTGGIEPRYYYKLKKSIAEGKSAHNFSGAYWGLPILYSYQSDNYPRNSSNQINNVDIDYIQKSLVAGISFGIQRKLFKNGYFDVSAGIGRTFLTANNGLTFIGKFEMGFAF